MMIDVKFPTICGDVLQVYLVVQTRKLRETTANAYAMPNVRNENEVGG